MKRLGVIECTDRETDIALAGVVLNEEEQERRER